MKLFLHRFIAVFIGLAGTIFLQAVDPVDIELITVGEGLSNNRVNTVFQDRNGFLWIGTDDGLNRYDGYHFLVFREEAFRDSSLSSNTITCITEDKEGELWIGTAEGINRYDRKTNAFVRYAVPGDVNTGFQVESMVADPSGDIWAITEDHFFKLNPASQTNESIRLSGTDAQPLLFRSGRLYLDGEGSIWIGTRSGLYVKKKGDDFLRATSFSGIRVFCFMEGTDKHLWLGTSEGLVRYNMETGKWNVFAPALPGYKQVRGIVDLQDGTFQLIGDQGFIRFNLSGERFMKTGDMSLYGRFFNFPQVRNSCLDRSGILWMASGQGLMRHDFKPRIFAKYSADETSFPRLPTNMIYALYKDESGRIWMGARNMGLVIMDRSNGVILNYSSSGKGKFQLPIRNVMEILRDRHKRVWVCGEKICFYQENSGSFVQMHSYFDIPSEQIPDFERVYDVLESSPGIYLIGARNGLWIFDEFNRSFHCDTLIRTDSLTIPLKEVAAVEMDTLGNIWLGCSSGVIRMDQNLVFERFYEQGEKTGLTGNQTYSILCDRNGGIWVGTSGGMGRYLAADDRFKPYTVQDGLPNDFIYAMLEDNRGNIWISTNQGLSMLDPVSGNFFNYEMKDGLQSMEFNLHAAYRADDNELLFGGIGGVNCFYPDSITHMGSVPNVAITGVKFLSFIREGQAWNPGQNRIHISDRQSVQISFAALDFTSSRHNSYRYRLAGYGDQHGYISLGRDNSLILSGLKYGSYRFEVLGSNSDGIWSEEPATLEILVSAPFYRHRLFYLLLISVFVILVYLTYRFRTRTLRQSNRILREKEIAALEVLRQRNLLIRRNKNIEDSLMYAQRIQQAMFTTIKDVQRLFPESFVLQRPKDIVSGDFYWARGIDQKIFLAAADCTGHGVPGAFMSLIGLELFRQIITGKQIFRPAEILDELNRNFSIIFGNMEDISLKDGMDLSFCTFHTDTNVMEFAGAFNPVYLIRNREIIEIKGDRISVGPDNGFVRPNFTNQSIQLEKDDIIYMFSDGYADQFGGPEGKKFKFRRFRHLLLSIHHLPMERQRKVLEDSILDWIGDYEQVDDIMVLGIRPYTERN